MILHVNNVQQRKDKLRQGRNDKMDDDDFFNIFYGHRHLRNLMGINLNTNKGDKWACKIQTTKLPYTDDAFEMTAWLFKPRGTTDAHRTYQYWETIHFEPEKGRMNVTHEAESKYYDKNHMDQADK